MVRHSVFHIYVTYWTRKNKKKVNLCVYCKDSILTVRCNIENNIVQSLYLKPHMTSIFINRRIRSIIIGYEHDENIY